jgi:hypothetical protein
MLLALSRTPALREWFAMDHLRTLLHEHEAEGLALFVVLFMFGNVLHVSGGSL